MPTPTLQTPWWSNWGSGLIFQTRLQCSRLWGSHCYGDGSMFNTSTDRKPRYGVPSVLRSFIVDMPKCQLQPRCHEGIKRICFSKTRPTTQTAKATMRFDSTWPLFPSPSCTSFGTTPFRRTCVFFGGKRWLLRIVWCAWNLPRSNFGVCHMFTVMRHNLIISNI